MRRLIGRLLSGHVRQLERELLQCESDLDAFRKGELEKLSVLQMQYTPERGMEASFQGGHFARMFAAWAFNTLAAVDAKNFVEFQVYHPTDGAITITVQRTRGETPGAKAARLEAELEKLKAAA